MVLAEDASLGPERQGTNKAGTGQDQRPRGFVAIGVFFLFGATMATYAAATLLRPGTALDRLWTLNKTGHAQLASLGKDAALGFIVLSAVMLAAAIGWFRRPSHDRPCPTLPFTNSGALMRSP